MSEKTDGRSELPDADAPGMTLRDWFAGESLKGGADSVCDNLSDTDNNPDEQLAKAIHHAARHAKAAYILADAMLAERVK